MASYKVKELFRTLQGEGAHAGRVAVFCRFTGCNLWTGRECDRAKGSADCSQWCDTDFVGTDGSGGGRFESADALADVVHKVWFQSMHNTRSKPFVVCTGGEPLLQLDQALIDALHKRGFEVAIETNGTIEVPNGVDWVCVSPKAGSKLVVTSGHELKVVIPQKGLDPADLATLNFAHYFVQPKDEGESKQTHLEDAIRYCMAHPQWRLSVQTHKLIGIP
jgi:7-carboxy-7-deazaguanine synthase (Cx14CxxC type)